MKATHHNDYWLVEYTTPDTGAVFMFSGDTLSAALKTAYETIQYWEHQWTITNSDQ